MRKKIDLTGTRYGKLTVIEEADKYISPSGHKYTRWKCQCDCGNIIYATSNNLRRGHYKSCGCFRKTYGEKAKDINTTHGGTANGEHERLYKVWANMKARCYNPNNLRYKDWGGRGIEVCDAWKDDYKSFRQWALENGYDETAERGCCTLDRIDNDGNYCPNNCRWSTAKEQAQNRRPKRMGAVRHSCKNS